jgi:hypothetical protein
VATSGAAQTIPVDPPEIGADLWWDGFFEPGLGGHWARRGYRVTVLENMGAELIVGGTLEIRGAEPIRDAARFDGTTWRSLGEGPGGRILAGARHADALVCVVDGPPLRLRSWDGIRWTTLAEVPIRRSPQPRRSGSASSIAPPRLLAVASYAGEIVIGGSFDHVGDVPATSVAAWNGSQWHALGDGLSSPLASECAEVGFFAIYAGSLVAAGSFSGPDDSYPLRNIASWNGDRWLDLDTGLPGAVRGLAVHDGYLYASGDFAPVDTPFVNSLDRLARWSGGRWKSLKAILPPRFYVSNVFASFRGLIVTGRFADRSGPWIIIGDFATVALLWDGSAWATLGADVRNGFISRVSQFGATLVAGGSFSSIDEGAANGLAFFESDRWRGAVPGRSLDAPDDGHGFRGEAITFLQDGNDLVVGGRFEFAGERQAGGIARWRDGTWHALGRGTDGTVYALARWNGLLVASGGFHRAGDVSATNIAAWDGTRWSAFGPGLHGGVLALADYRGALVAGGSFTQSGERYMSGVARWDGAAWQPMGNGLFYGVRALLVHGDALLAAGGFNWDGQHALSCVARWTGERWTSFGTIRGGATHLRVIGGELYAVGGFALSASPLAPRYRVVRWDGTNWMPVGDRPDLFVSDVASYRGDVVGSVAYYTAFPDHGPLAGRLYRLANGTWEPLSRAIRSLPTTLAVHDGSLYCGGHFMFAGDTRESVGIARWDGGATAIVLADARAEALSEGGIRISWRASSDSQRLQVDVLRSDAATGPWQLQASHHGNSHAAGSWVDALVEPGREYWYRLEVLDSAGVRTGAGPLHASARAWATALEPIAIGIAGKPVRIAFRVGTAGDARISVFDVAGRRIRSFVQAKVSPGRYTIDWDGASDQGSAVVRGVYFVRLEIAGGTDIRKMLIAGR